MRPKKRPTVMSLMVLRIAESNNIAGVQYLEMTKTVIGKDVAFNRISGGFNERIFLSWEPWPHLYY
jgi:hypothetical protein